MSHHGCPTPRTWFRRCGAVWACSCGKLWTLGLAFDFFSASKAWVPLDVVRDLAAARGEA